MNRLPSLAAGISGAGFEWNPSPATSPSPMPSNLSTESHLTFATVPTDDSSSRPAQSTAQFPADATADACQKDLHEASDEDTAGDPMGEDKAEDARMSADTTHEEDAGAGSLFSAMQTKAPGLTPLRLVPKTEPAQPRSAHLSLHPPVHCSTCLCALLNTGIGLVFEHGTFSLCMQSRCTSIDETLRLIPGLPPKLSCCMATPLFMVVIRHGTQSSLIVIPGHSGSCCTWTQWPCTTSVH